MLLITPTWADNVYYAGFEDSVGGDYDYNDLVFSIGGTGLTLNHTTGTFQPEPTLGTSGTPFWNRASGDGPLFNVGYCIYGGGNCNGGTGLAPTDDYLATVTGGPVNDVTFSFTGPAGPGSVDSPVFLHIAGDTDLVGWYLLSDPTHTPHWINSAGGQTGDFSFDPGGAFGLVGNNGGGTGGDTFYSQNGVAGTDDTFGSHFAFFGSVTVPEPGSMILFGTALLGLSVMLRRRKNAQ